MGKSKGCCCRQRFCSACLLGLFSCHWTHKKGLKTSKCDCAWFFLLFCVGLLALAWLYVALITLNDFHNLNEFVFQKTEWWLDWSVVMLSVTATLVIYSSLLLILALCLQLCHQPLKLHWLHKGLLILTALIVVAAFVGLEIQWSEQWESAHIALQSWEDSQTVACLGQPSLGAQGPWKGQPPCIVSCQATGPFLHIGAVAGLTMLAWPVAACFYHISHADSPGSIERGKQSSSPTLWAGIFQPDARKTFLSPRAEHLGEPQGEMVGCPWLQAFSQNWAVFCWGCPDLDTRQAFSPRAAANPAMLGIGQGEQIPRINGKMKSTLRVLLLLLYLGATLALYLAPLGIDSPCFLEQSQLPPKPALFGHRGAPMLAPENTMMSFQKAVNCGLSVLETDVRVSADGIPFLMHDETLLRTTNVQEVFPTQAHAKATTFSWTQLQQLDAGSWFLQKHPFSTAWSLSEEEMAQARKQHVLSLKELLAEAKRHQVSVIFDLMPLEDPHYERLVNITVETVLQSGIGQELILWLPNQFRKQVKQQAPRFQHIYGLESLVNKTIRFPRVNLAYQKLSSAEISEYHRNNISVNLYVINAPWLFSLLWCAGTSSVTTNACQVLQKMQRPTWLLKMVLEKGLKRFQLRCAPDEDPQPLVRVKQERPEAPDVALPLASFGRALRFQRFFWEQPVLGACWQQLLRLLESVSGACIAQPKKSSRCRGSSRQPGCCISSCKTGTRDLPQQDPDPRITVQPQDRIRELPTLLDDNFLLDVGLGVPPTNKAVCTGWETMLL
ncbi:hypothetical protein Chor_004752 [Crotalus horridus]